MSRKKKGKGFIEGFGKILIGIIVVAVAFLTAYFYDEDSTIKETNLPDHTGNFFIEDYSGVLNDFTERYIMDEAVKLYRKTKAQVVVVMVPNTQADTLYDFSIGLANKWGIGDEKLDNGILILFDTTEGDSHVRLEVGKGLEGAITDGKAGRILDGYAVEAKDNGLFNTAAGDTFVATVSEVYKNYGLEIPDSLIFQEWEIEGAETKGTFADAPYPEMIIKENEESALSRLFGAFLEAIFTVILIIVVIIVILAITLFSGGGGYRSGGGGGGGGFSGGGGSFGGGGASR